MFRRGAARGRGDATTGEDDDANRTGRCYQRREWVLPPATADAASQGRWCYHGRRRWLVLPKCSEVATKGIPWYYQGTAAPLPAEVPC